MKQKLASKLIMRLKTNFFLVWLARCELCNAVNDNNNIPDFFFKLSRSFFLASNSTISLILKEFSYSKFCVSVSNLAMKSSKKIHITNQSPTLKLICSSFFPQQRNFSSSQRNAFEILNEIKCLARKTSPNQSQSFFFLFWINKLSDVIFIFPSLCW